MAFSNFQTDAKFYLDARLPADSCLPLTIVREARSAEFANHDNGDDKLVMVLMVNKCFGHVWVGIFVAVVKLKNGMPVPDLYLPMLKMRAPAGA